MEHLGVRELRDQLGRRIDEAFFRDTFVVIEKNGEPRAVLVSIDWFNQMSKGSSD
jgi:prevent-host-death family protein